MMGKICIHYEDEVPSSMLHAVDVGSAFERKPELMSGKKICRYEYRNVLFRISPHRALNLPRPNFFALGRRS